MPCFYACASEHRHMFGPYTQLKFGITQHTDPTPRLRAYAHSKNTPWGGPYYPTLLFSIAMESTDDALHIEGLIRLEARLILPRLGLGLRPDVMSVLSKDQRSNRDPSCEWLLHPADGLYAGLDLIGFAMLTLQKRRRYGHERELLSERSLGAFAAAGFALSSGFGCVDLDIRSGQS
jgi:hypothetical protein